MTTVDWQTCAHILAIITTSIATASDKLTLHCCIDSKPATTETAATAAARYHAASGWLCKGTFTAHPVQQYSFYCRCCGIAFSALTLLVGWQEGHPVCKKTEWWDAGVVICLERGADLHLAQLMPLPLTVSCFSKIKIGSTFLVLAHLGSPGKRAVKWTRARVLMLWHTPRRSL